MQIEELMYMAVRNPTATPRQIDTLVRLGLPTVDVSLALASSWIDRCKNNGWQQTDEVKVESVWIRSA